MAEMRLTEADGHQVRAVVESSININLAGAYGSTVWRHDTQDWGVGLVRFETIVGLRQPVRSGRVWHLM